MKALKAFPVAVLLLPVLAAAQERSSLPLPEPPPGAFEYSADHFEYEGSTSGADSRILLQGKVEVRDSTWTLRAGEMRMERSSRKAHASGGFEMTDGFQTLRGERGTFDLSDRTGAVEDVTTGVPPWTIRAKSGRLDAEGKAHFSGARLTSCDAEPPHYHIRAGGVHVKRGHWLTATNARFHLGPVPFFYTPFMWKSLNPDRFLKTRLAPGYDKRSGAMARTSTMFDLHRSLHGKLFLDYYEAQGFGAGSELQMRPSEDSRGALYGYRIRETGTDPVTETGIDPERWTVLGSYYQSLGEHYAAQGRLQAQSDPEVNNHYVRSNAFRVTSQLVNGGAFVRRTAKTTTRVSVSRTDDADPATGRFHKTKETLPRLDFNTAPFGHRRIPALFGFSAFADNSLVRGTGYAQRSAGGELSATRSVNVIRKLTVTPKAAFRELYESHREVEISSGTRPVIDAYTAFYDLGSNLRVYTPLGVWDAGYLFTRRLKTNTMRGDAGAPDYGVEANQFSVLDTFRPTRKVLVRLGSGYDLRRFRNREPGFRRRVSPIVSDVLITPRRRLSLQVREVYQLDDGSRSLLFQGDWGDREGAFLGAGYTYSKTRADEHIGSVEAGWTPKGRSYRIGGALRGLVASAGGFDLRRARLFDKELSVTKDFHDFHTQFLVRFRTGGVKEFHVRVDLVTFHTVKQKKARRESEKEWFPWRKNVDEDDRE